MAERLTQGLVISALGLGLTFAALGLFILVMILLQRLFRARSTDARPANEPPDAQPPSARDDEAQEIAAAIAIALSTLRAQEMRESGLGQALEAGRGAYWHAGTVIAAQVPEERRPHA